MSNGSSWSARLAALDAASLRLADKTRSLNDLLRDLQHGGAGAAAPGVSASAAASARSSPMPAAAAAMARPPMLAAQPAPLPTMVLPASSVSRANEQIQRVQQWLAQLNSLLQKAPNESAPPPPQAASALDTLARMQAMVAASDLSAPPSPAVKPLSNGFLSPPGAALPASQSNSAGSASSSSLSSANVANAKRSVKGTIQPLQPLGGGAQMGLAGVHVPAGTVFVDGKWQRVRHSSGSGGGGKSPSHAGQHPDSEEEPDPFADFSDHDASLPGTPRRASLLESKAAASPPLSSFRKKNSPSINTLKRRGEGEKDIGEEDVAEFENREAAAASGAGGMRVPKSPSVVLEDGQWHTDTVREEEEADIFADIEDLEVNPAEEERRRAAEIARSSSSAAALAPSPTSHVKSAAEVSARAKAIRNKTSTLRKDLFKHMGQDVEIDEGDVASLVEEEDDTQQQQQADAASAAAAVSASPSPASPAAAGAAAVDEDEFDVAAELESPRPAAHVFKPDLEATKSAAGVTELNTRKEGQEQEADEWNDVELKREHLRKASNSALKHADDRPDDLDGLSEDEDEQAPEPAPRPTVASSPASRNGVPAGTVTHLHTPSSKSFGGGGGRHSAAASSSSFGGSAFEDDDFSDLDHSRITFSGSGSVSKSNRTMHHSHSASASSVQSVQSNHGQLSAQLSDDDADDLDDMLDEDEQAQSSIKVDVSRSQADRASRKLDEFDVSKLSSVFSESESSRSRFLGSTDLHSLAVLQRPVDERWMMELAAECKPPKQQSRELPHLQHDAALAQSRAHSSADDAAAAAPVPQTPEKSSAASAASPAAEASDSTPGAPASSSGSKSSNNKKNKKGKNKQSR